MAIKEAKQSGSNVSVKYGNSTKLIDNSKLIGYTQNALFVENGRTITIYVEQNGVMVTTSSRIYLSSNDKVKFCGNTLEVIHGTTKSVYNEKGSKIKTTNA